MRFKHFLRNLHSLVSLLLLAGGTTQVVAQNEPVYLYFKFDDGAIINSMSDNGLWAAAHGSNAENTLLSTGPRLLDLSTGGVVELTAGMAATEVASASACDVTNDGSVVVGELNGRPAYWSKADGKWHNFRLPVGCNGGIANSVTPDGRWAVGIVNHSDDIFGEQPAMWEVATGTLVKTEGLPTADMAHEDKGQNRFVAISADGSKILGCMSVSYLPSSETLGGRFNYIYNVAEKTYVPIGFDETKTGRWTAHADGLLFLSTAQLSNNGLYVTGAAYMAKEVAGSDFPDEYEVPYVYNTQSNTFTAYDTTEDKGVGGWVISNDGVMLGATPINNPFREWSIRRGNYWYDIRHVAREKYQYDLIQKIGIDNSGTPLSVSNDGSRVAVIVDPYSSYVLQLPETFDKACEGIDLLGSYNVNPAQGSAVSKLQKITLTFDRNIEVIGAGNCAEIRNESGATVYSSVGFKMGDNNRMLSITFRKGNLDAGKNYSLYIPAGSVCVAGDKQQVNKDIVLRYSGRAETPVKMVEVFPANGAAFAKIDAATQPILLSFDTQVMVPQEVTAKLYRDNETTPVTDLLLAYAAHQVAIYPAATQYLYKGANYRVEIPAGAITDVTGNCGNEAITLQYVGAYEREVSLDDKTLFSDDFSNGFNAFMLYDGDRLTPHPLMQAWGFADAQNYPWTLVRDNESSTDMAAASHSMYEEGGAAQDWMVTPQIYIPDEQCVLRFLSQSYLDSATDYLKVIVWKEDQVYHVLNETTVKKILEEGTVVYHQQQNCGATEDGLDNEWTKNEVSLEQFAGENIYIAFLNDNENQSAVMLDNVEVLHNIPFLVTFDHETTVVDKTTATVRGRVTIDDDSKTYEQVALMLKNSQGEVVSTVNESGLQLKKGDTYAFSFETPLTLEKGTMNAFTVVVTLDDKTNSIEGKIKNLAFEPTKRVVLEEFSGMTCQNCPLGILAVEKIKSTYGQQFIPLVLHTYQGDPLGAGLDEYSNYFNFSGAPQGMVGRSGIISSPMISVNGDYRFNGENGEKLWLDLVAEELSVRAEADVQAEAGFTDETQSAIVVPTTVRYALDGDALNTNLFVAILEDDVVGYQYNNLYTVSDDDLGEWAEGGAYAKSTIYPYTHQHVVRGWEGRTVAGTGGLIPATVKANTDYHVNITAAVPTTVSNKENLSVVVMLIDGNTERVINAVAAPVKGIISHIEGATTCESLQIQTDQRGIVVTTTENLHIEVYAANGSRIGGAEGRGTLHIPTAGYRGVAIVKAQQGTSTISVQKIIL